MLLGRPGFGAFDLLAYPDGREISIAGEAKSTQKEAIKLMAGLRRCGALGHHEEHECAESPNHHRKYQGLLDYAAPVLWIIGPDTFSGTIDLIFRVADGVVEFQAADATALIAT